MELEVLRRLVAEAAVQLLGRRVEQIYALGGDHLVVAFVGVSPGRLWFAAGGDEPHLYLRPGPHHTPERPPGFAMGARKLLRGRRLDALELVGGDRIVQLRCGDDAMIFEILPRRGACLLVAGGSVLAVWSGRRGQARQGQAYAPPTRPARLPLGQGSRGLREELVTAAAAGQTGVLVRGIDGLTPLLAREVTAAVAAGEPLEVAVAAVVGQAEATPTAARIYSPWPLASATLMPDPGAVELAPFALRSRPAEHHTHYPSMLEAAAAFYPEIARLRLLQRVRAAIEGAAARRLARLQRDRRPAAESAGGDPVRLRQLGDLLLANPAIAVEGGSVTVADLYGDGHAIDIPVDAALGVSANAEKLYRRARRIERAREAEANRQERSEAEARRLHALLAELPEVADAAAAVAVVRRATGLGLEVRWERFADPEVPGSEPAIPPGASEPRSLPGMLRLRSPDDNEILVGRSAAGNERLTHELALPHDWWLHAGGPGAHVLLRNPERLQQPRPEALVMAARLAAWFSQERGAGKVEVHWTQARHVLRVRGGAPGTVRLRQHHTLLVSPGSPAELGDQAG